MVLIFLVSVAAVLVGFGAVVYCCVRLSAKRNRLQNDQEQQAYISRYPNAHKK